MCNDFKNCTHFTVIINFSYRSGLRIIESSDMSSSEFVTSKPYLKLSRQITIQIIDSTQIYNSPKITDAEQSKQSWKRKFEMATSDLWSVGLFKAVDTDLALFLFPFMGKGRQFVPLAELLQEMFFIWSCIRVLRNLIL